MKAVEDQRNKSKTQVNRLGMLSEQRVRNLSEEMTKLRENLSTTHKELNDLRRQLDKEVCGIKINTFFDSPTVSICSPSPLLLFLLVEG